MNTVVSIASVQEKFQLLSATMTERMRRHWAAAEALALPRGGISLVAEATGLSRTTITAGNCQGTLTITRLRDTNCYEHNR
jgi:hypothetical protein